MFLPKVLPLAVIQNVFFNTCLYFDLINRSENISNKFSRHGV